MAGLLLMPLPTRDLSVGWTVSPTDIYRDLTSCSVKKVKQFFYGRILGIIW
jgi:hypothetical protein